MAIHSKRIAILFHERDHNLDLSTYIVHHLAGFWREDGHEVIYLFGTNRFVPADIILVHVDLSVVPDNFIKFASRYPIRLNCSLRDIRKSVTSCNLLSNRDLCDGPVIIKSDLNCGGIPEKIRTQTWFDMHLPKLNYIKRVYRKITRTHESFPDIEEYRIYKNIADVPKFFFEDKRIVIEKFLPELENGLYHCRMCLFLGNRWLSVRLASPHPFVKAGNSVRAEMIDPHPEVLAWRESLKLEYGKLDYVIYNNNAVLLDVNKTIGASRHIANDQLRAMRQHLAMGLYYWLL